VNLDDEADLPCPCYTCSTIVAYAAVGANGTYHFKAAEDAKQVYAAGGEWVFEGSCGHRTVMYRSRP
jgi:hypothetical protein